MAKKDHDLPSLDALQDKIDDAKPQSKNGGGASVEYSKDMSIAMRFLVELVAGVAVGGFIGHYLDNWLGSSPICLIIFILLGTAASVRTMLKSDKTANTP